jgi:hypothetical protein
MDYKIFFPGLSGLRIDMVSPLVRIKGTGRLGYREVWLWLEEWMEFLRVK